MDENRLGGNGWDWPIDRLLFSWMWWGNQKWNDGISVNDEGDDKSW